MRAPGGALAQGNTRMHEYRTVSSYVTQMSMVKNCPSHIKGAYQLTLTEGSVFVIDDEASEDAEE